MNIRQDSYNSYHISVYAWFFKHNFFGGMITALMAANCSMLRYQKTHLQLTYPNSISLASLNALCAGITHSIPLNATKTLPRTHDRHPVVKCSSKFCSEALSSIKYFHYPLAAWKDIFDVLMNWKMTSVKVE